MTQNLEPKTLKHTIIDKQPGGDSSIRKVHRPTRADGTEPKAYNRDKHLYSNRCAPWRYAKIFRNTTVRP